MDLKEIAEAYQLVYEKKKLDPVGKEDDDVDNDGDSDSSDEYLKKRRAAIGKAMGKDGDKEEDEEEKEDKKKDKKESLDLMSAYYSMYEHHKKDEDGNTIPHEEEIDEEQVKKLKPNYKHQRYADSTKFDDAASYDKLEAGREKAKERKKDEAKKSIEKFRTGVQNMPSKRTVEGIDLSFVDELSEEELDVLVEEVVYDLLDEGIELDAIEGAFTVYLEEAKVTYGSDTEDPMVTAVKKRKEEKAKASKEKTEKLKKSIGKAVTKMKAKMHGGMANYASKRKLIPTKGAKAAAATPERVAPSEPKNKTKKAQKEFETQKKGVEMANKSRAEKMKKTQTAGNIKNTMKGSGAKQARKELRSAVFKDVKDRVGKKVQAVKDAPKKASERIQKGIGGLVKKGRTKIGGSLVALGKKMQEQGGELDMFDTVTAYLIDEGLVKDFDHAQRVMTTLDSTLIEEVHAEQMQLLKEYGGSTDKPMLVTNADKKGNTPAYQNMMKGMKSKVTGKPMYKKADHMESLEDAYLQVYAEKLDPMDFGKSKRTKEEKKKSRDEKKVNPVATKMYQRNHPAYGKKSTGLQ